jgi:O-antigen/teichoic acid export membrane protein
MIKNSLIFAFFSFLINSINFILIPIYTNNLSVQEYGAMASISIFITAFTTVFTFGVNGAISKMYFDLSNQKEEDEFILTTFATKLIISTTILLLFLLNNGLFLNNIFKNIKFNPYLKYSLLISYFNIFSVVPLSLLLVKGNALKYRILTSTYFILNSILTLFNLLILKTGLIGIFKAQLYANLLMAIYYISSIYYKRQFNFSKKVSYTLIIFGFPIMLYNLSGMIIEQSSKILIERLLSLKDLGIYNLAFQFSSIIVLINNAINMAWVPIYFKESKENENSNLFQLFSKYLFILLSFIALLIAVFQKYFLIFILTKNYETAEIYIPILVYVFVLTNTYWVLLINPIFQSKQIKYLPGLAIISGGLSIFLCYLLIPKFGLIGAIISVFVGNLSMNFMTYLIIKRKMILRYDNKKLITIILISFILFILTTLIHNNNLLVEIILKIVIVSFYVFILIVTKIFKFKEVKLLNFNKQNA